MKTRNAGISRNMAEYHGICRNITEYAGISRNMAEYHGICRNITEYQAIFKIGIGNGGNAGMRECGNAGMREYRLMNFS